MDPMSQLGEIEDMLEIEAKWILENAFEGSVSDQTLVDPLHPREAIEVNSKARFNDVDKRPNVYITPYPTKKIDDEAKVFLKSRDYQGIRRDL